MDQNANAGEVAALARDFIAEHPGVHTSELLAHLAPHTEQTRLALLSELHRHGRKLGYGQDDDFRWYTQEANDYIATVIAQDESTTSAEQFHQARATLGAVVRAGRALTAVPGELIPALEDAGVRIHDRPSNLGYWFTPDQREDVVQIVQAPRPASVLDEIVLATPRAAAISVRERLLEAGRRDLAIVLDPDEHCGAPAVARAA